MTIEYAERKYDDALTRWFSVHGMLNMAELNPSRNFEYGRSNWDWN